ncbi:hypothetical protein [Desulfatitalea alkaliphila]|uniref:Uncharacterized protein n=1 Tax=Desulfatitalea alkaliphila TaxID=2929485 RepID=A0AA41UJM7_9BACT|nr:hypothetical protein [Desulfatitalea alkaliphila]MCJ8501329.1 hypothetical protein [Desulfatitalea alkaliphila]
MTHIEMVGKPAQASQQVPAGSVHRHHDPSELQNRRIVRQTADRPDAGVVQWQ